MRRHRRFKHHKNIRRHKINRPTRNVLGIIFAVTFLIVAFFYYSANNTMGFVFVLDYPVSSIFYWIGSAIIGFLIYKIFNN